MAATALRILSIVSDAGGAIALRDYLAKIPDLSLVAEAASESEALQRLEELSVDVVVLDLLQGDTNGIALTEKIRESYPGVRVVIATASDTPEDIFGVMDAGADGYVLHGNYTGLEMALRSARLGTVWLDPGIATQVLEAIVAASTSKIKRTLPTGIMSIPLLPEEREVLDAVASSTCTDGVCMVDPAFLKRLRRFARRDED
ncbi:MAG TPA: response regulator transcription factor [Candidatus Obscuribacterales bacterium]